MKSERQFGLSRARTSHRPYNDYGQVSGVFVTQGDRIVVTASFGLVSLLAVWDYREYIGVFVRLLVCHEGRVHSSCVATHVQAMTCCVL